MFDVGCNYVVGGWGKQLNILDFTLEVYIFKNIEKKNKKNQRLRSSFSLNLFKDGRYCFLLDLESFVKVPLRRTTVLC